MSMYTLTGKLFGHSKTTKMSFERPPTELVHQIQSERPPTKLVHQIQSRSKTPPNAKDNNEQYWPRIYEKAIKKGNPNIGKEDLKQQVKQLVRLRKELKDERLATKHLQTEFRQSSQPHKSMDRSMYGPNIPVFALDTNEHHWPRIYENAIRNGNPNIGKEDLKQQVEQRVQLRKRRNDERQKTTMRRGGKKSRKKSRRKSRSLLSFFY